MKLNTEWSADLDQENGAGVTSEPWLKIITKESGEEVRVIDWPLYFDAGRIDLGATVGMDADEIRDTLPPPVVHGLLRHGSVGLLAGASKARKSWLALALAISAATGKHWLGFRVEPTRVRYIDFELKARTAAYRYSIARLGVTDDPAEQAAIDANVTFHSLRSMPAEKGTLAGVAAWIEAAGRPGELWILDCLQPVLEGDANDPAKVRSAFQPLLKASEKAGVVLLLIDHFNKNSEARGMARVSGSVAKVAAADAIITLSPRGDGVIGVDFDLREDPPVDGETLIRFNFATHGFDLVTPGEAEAAKSKAEKERHMEWIGQGWATGDAAKTRKELAKAWKLGATGALDRLRELEAAGRVEEGAKRKNANTYQLSLANG